MEQYDYIKLEKMLHENESRGNCVHKLSDWNSSLEEVKVPIEIYADAFAKSIKTITKYPETSVTDEICRDLAKNLSGSGVKVHAMHLYGSGTQAINMLFYALHEMHKNKKQNKNTIIFINPTYFSSIQSAESFGFKSKQLFRKSKDNFSINIDELASIIDQSRKDNEHVCAVFITEPVYASGVCLPLKELYALSKFCKDKGVYLAIDGSFSGLRWHSAPHWQDKNLLTLAKDDHVAIIDSLSKKTFILNTKIGVLYGSKKLIEAARNGADWLSGNITSLQQELTRMLFSSKPQYADALSSVVAENLSKFSDRFNLISGLIENSQYKVIKPDAGYHLLVISKELKENAEVDVMSWSYRLMDKGVFALPTLDFGYSMDDYFGFRISLSRNHNQEMIKAALNEVI